MRSRRLVTLLAAVVPLFAFIGCSDDDSSGEEAPPTEEAPPPVEELYEQGPWAVGHTQSTVAYRPPGAEHDRPLPVRIWYPSPPDVTGEPADYAVGGIVEIPAPHALEATRVAAGESFPLAVYSHGSGGDNLLAYPYAERMASHGWIVIAPNHVGNTALGEELPTAELLVKRVTDISALLDAATSGFGDDALSGRVDLERVFLFGHSFGAYTTLVAGGATLDYDKMLELCDPVDAEDCAYLKREAVEDAVRAGLADPRIDAIAPQAPALSRVFASDGYADVGVSTLLMSGQLDRTTPESTETLPVWEGLDHPEDAWIDIPTGAHFTFISICHDLSEALIKAFQPDAFEDGCGPDFIPTVEAVPALVAYVLAYAELHVRGNARWRPLFADYPLDPRFVLSTHADAATTAAVR